MISYKFVGDTERSARASGADLLKPAAINRALKESMIAACTRWRAKYLDRRFSWEFADLTGYKQTPKNMERKARKIERSSSSLVAHSSNPDWVAFRERQKVSPIIPIPRSGSSRGEWNDYWAQLGRHFRAEQLKKVAGAELRSRVTPGVWRGFLRNLAPTGIIKATATSTKGVMGRVPIPTGHPVPSKVSKLISYVPNGEIIQHARWFAEEVEARMSVLLGTATEKARAKAEKQRTRQEKQQRKTTRTKQRRAA